jgi:hypothetical protein
MKDILIICPTFKRQSKIGYCINGWRSTTTGNSDLMLVTEEGDNYPLEDDVIDYKGKFGTMVNALNQAFINHPGYKIYGFIGDDHIFRTKGWEEKIIDTLKNGGIAYGDDLLQRERLATAAFLSADIPTKLGYMALPDLIHLYVDDYWMAVGRHIGKLFYVPEVVIEHMHPGASKAPMDSEYTRVNSHYQHDGEVFEEWKQAKPDMEKLK